MSDKSCVTCIHYCSASSIGNREEPPENVDWCNKDHDIWQDGEDDKRISPEAMAQHCLDYQVVTCKCEICKCDLGPAHLWDIWVQDPCSGEPIPVCTEHESELRRQNAIVMEQLKQYDGRW